MKKRNIKTVRLYNPERSAIEIKTRGHWRQGFEVRRAPGGGEIRIPLIFRFEYDACAKLLSMFERDFTPTVG